MNLNRLDKESLGYDQGTCEFKNGSPSCTALEQIMTGEAESEAEG